MSTIILALLALVAAGAAGVYAHSARLRLRLVRLVDNDPSVDVEAHSLAFASYRKEAHTSLVYGMVALAAAVVAIFGNGDGVTAAFGVLAVPAAAALWWSRSSSRCTSSTATRSAPARSLRSRPCTTR